MPLTLFENPPCTLIGLDDLKTMVQQHRRVMVVAAPCGDCRAHKARNHSNAARDARQGRHAVQRSDLRQSHRSQRSAAHKADCGTVAPEGDDRRQRELAATMICVADGRGELRWSREPPYVVRRGGPADGAFTAESRKANELA